MKTPWNELTAVNIYWNMIVCSLTERIPNTHVTPNTGINMRVNLAVWRSLLNSFSSTDIFCDVFRVVTNIILFTTNTKHAGPTNTQIT